MKLTLIRKAEQNVSSWSGGTTTELFIYPFASSYTRRDFDIRISTATVQQSPSTFTDLSGYNRLLMPLSAPLTLTFNNTGGDSLHVQNFHRAEACDDLSLQATHLKPFETIAFSGGTSTVSTGICTDIGIIHKDGYLCHMQARGVGKYTTARLFTCVYALADGLALNCQDQSISLDFGDFLIIEFDCHPNSHPQSSLASQGNKAKTADHPTQSGEQNAEFTLNLPNQTTQNKLIHPVAIVFYVEKHEQ